MSGDGDRRRRRRAGDHATDERTRRRRRRPPTTDERATDDEGGPASAGAASVGEDAGGFFADEPVDGDGEDGTVTGAESGGSTTDGTAGAERSTIELEIETVDHPPEEPAATRREPRDVSHSDRGLDREARRRGEGQPYKERALLRGVDLVAAAVTRWRALRESSRRAAIERLASRHLGPYVRDREAEFAGYRQRHVQARIDRDWDVQLAVGTLVTAVATVAAVAAATAGSVLWVGLPALEGILVGLFGGAWTVAGGYYWYTSGKTRVRTYQRRREIEKLLPQAVAYMFSHSQGQQTVPEIIENLANEGDTYGAISEEFGVVHKEVSIFESDLRHALRKARETTPSANLAAFFDELLNVIDTSGELTAFLREKTEEYQSQSLVEEERFIGRLSLAAFAYTFAGVFVPVMVIITLVFLSMMGMDVLWLGLVLAWGYVSVLSVGTWLAVRVLAVDDMNTTPTLETTYAGASIDGISSRLDVDGADVAELADRPSGAAADGGLHRPLEDPRLVESRVDGHDAPLSERERHGLVGLRRALKVVGARRALDNVWELLNRQPLYTLVATAPAALLVVVVALVADLAAVPWPGLVEAPVRDTTAVLVVPLAVVLGPLWYFSRRLRKHDTAVREELPNMLRKLSSATEAGTPFVESIKTVGETAEDDLSGELRLMRNELTTFFADLENALVRMANRVRNPRLTRVTTLLVEANTSSGNVQDILAVAARDAENSKRLDEKRFSKMERQMFVIVMGYFSFLVIAGAFQFFLLPHIVEALSFAGDVDTARLDFFPTVDETLFTLVMFHSAVSIGLFSGLVAGKFGYDDARAGAGWALLKVAAATAIFWAAALVV